MTVGRGTSHKHGMCFLDGMPGSFSASPLSFAVACFMCSNFHSLLPTCLYTPVPFLEWQAGWGGCGLCEPRLSKLPASPGVEEENCGQLGDR